jgi:hypothetical protein
VFRDKHKMRKCENAKIVKGNIDVTLSSLQRTLQGMPQDTKREGTTADPMFCRQSLLLEDTFLNH